MAKKNSNSKKGKSRRVPKEKIASYWNERHVPNMLRRALRILKHEGRPAADRFVSLHSNGCKSCAVILDARYRKVVG